MYMTLFLKLLFWAVAVEGYIDTTMESSIKAFGLKMDSSCVVVLHTPLQLKKDRYRIMRLIRSIGNDFIVDISITALPFKSFLHLRKTAENFLDCKSPMMVVFHDDEETRSQLTEMMHSLPMTYGSFWLVYTTKSFDWFKEMYIPFGIDFIVAREVNTSYVALYELYRVAKNWPLRYPVLGHWSSTDVEIPLSNTFSRRNNLEGFQLRTGSTQNPPIHSFEMKSTGDLELVGYFPDVWRELESILNFTSVHYPSVDNVTGIREKNGTWNGLIGMLHTGLIDVAVSEFIMDPQRSHVVEFSRPLLKTSYQIFFKSVGANYNWDAILRPFATDIWLMILTWIIVAAFVLAFINKQLKSRGLEPTSQDFNMTNSVFFLLKATSSQGHNVIPHSLSMRVLYLSAYMVTCLLVPSYSAYLISYLTFRTPKRPFDDLHGLLHAKTYKLQTNAKTAEYTYFSEATDPVLQKIYREMMIKIPPEDFPLNTKDALKRVCKDPFLAHFGDMAVAKSHLQYVRDHEKCEIVTLSQSISTIYSSMAFQRNSPYRAAVNHFLQRMEDTGLIDRLNIASFSIEKISTVPQAKHVEMSDVLQVFLLLIIGVSWAVIIFIAEHLHWRWKRRKNVQQAWTDKGKSTFFRTENERYLYIH